MTISRPAPGVVVLVIRGRDAGEHGEGPIHELEKDVAAGSFDLFVDARLTRGASLDVSNVWAQWLHLRRERLRRVNMLTGSPFVQLTADFVRRYAELGDAMRIYTDAVAFDAALAGAVSQASRTA